MTGHRTFWILKPTKEADTDLIGIPAWTKRPFGSAQMLTYRSTIEAAFKELRLGPLHPNIRHRGDIAPGLMTLHVARAGSKGRHLIVFRVAQGTDRPTLDILRILPDSMNLPHHLETPDGEEPPHP